jgi:septum formation protein
MTLILASGSASRRRMLDAAGLDFEVDAPRVDEEAAKLSLRAKGLTPRDQADALAELKALSISNRRAGLVIGADQMLSVGADILDKPASMDEARAHLNLLSGKTHVLLTAVCVAHDGEILWRHMETPRLKMRTLSEDFITTYLERAGGEVLKSVGAYQLEGLGAHLFERVEGDYFSVLGLPLLALLAFLREHGIALA